MRNQTLLHRDSAGYYEFAHKSLAEFFVALKFGAELDCIAQELRQLYKEENGIPCTLPYDRKTSAQLGDTFGKIQLYTEQIKIVSEMLKELMNRSSYEVLWEFIAETIGAQKKQIGYLGGNALTLCLRFNKQVPENVIKGAHISGSYFMLAGRPLGQHTAQDVLYMRVLSSDASRKSAWESCRGAIVSEVTLEMQVVFYKPVTMRGFPLDQLTSHLVRIQGVTGGQTGEFITKRNEPIYVIQLELDRYVEEDEFRSAIVRSLSDGWQLQSLYIP